MFLVSIELNEGSLRLRRYEGRKFLDHATIAAECLIDVSPGLVQQEVELFREYGK